MNVGDAIRGIRNQIKSILGAITELQDGVDTAGSHNLLSATHPDVTVGAPARGDLIVGQEVAPVWKKKALGANGKVLQSDGTDLVYGDVPAHTPAAHHASHEAGGSDIVKLDDLGAPDDNTDLDSSTSKHGLLKKLPNDAAKFLNGVGNWVEPAAGGGAEFLDNFTGASLDWGWRTHNTDANRTVTQSGGLLTIAIAAGTNGDWWTGTNNPPKALMGLFNGPTEVIVKINSYTVNEKTFGGIFVGIDAINNGADFWIMFGRQRNDGTGLDGLAIDICGTSRAWTSAVNTLPIWLKIRSTGGQNALFSFFYSTDGISYTDTTYTWGSLSTRAGALVVGLAAKNWTDNNAIAMPAESFQMTLSSGPG